MTVAAIAEVRQLSAEDFPNCLKKAVEGVRFWPSPLELSRHVLDEMHNYYGERVKIGLEDEARLLVGLALGRSEKSGEENPKVPFLRELQSLLDKNRARYVASLPMTDFKI